MSAGSIPDRVLVVDDEPAIRRDIANMSHVCT